MAIREKIFENEIGNDSFVFPVFKYDFHKSPLDGDLFEHLERLGTTPFWGQFTPMGDSTL